jgi:hypothetical protein
MMALFETADGMTKWIELEHRQLGDRYRFAIVPKLKLPPEFSDDVRFVPRWHTRTYELTEIRYDPAGNYYQYWREILE